MFEREIKFITDFSLNNIKKLGSFFTLEHLANARVHPAITQYISAEIDYLIYLDRQRLLQKSDFDYSGTEIAKHFDLIAAEIKKNKLIPFEEVKMRVQRAVNFNVNFLLRPHWTLRKFIFDQEESRSAEEVRLLLNYSYFYDYYKQYFNRLIERKKLLSFTKTEFSERFFVFRRELISSQFELFIDDVLSSHAEFLNMGESIKDRLAVGAIEAFLKDSDLTDQALKIRQQYAGDIKLKYAIADIKETLLSETPLVRTFEIKEEEPEDESIEPKDTAIDSLFLETQPPVDEPPVQEPETEAEPSPVHDEDAELDVSLQITELLTSQLLNDDAPRENAPPPEEEKSFDGVPAESILAEIKAAQEALSALSARNQEPEEIPEEDAADAFSIQLPEAVSEDVLTEDIEIEPLSLDEPIADEPVEEISVLDEETEDEATELPEEEIEAEEEAEPFIEEPEEEIQEEEAVDEEPGNEAPEDPVAEIQEEEEEEEEESALFRYFSTKETMRIISSVFANDQIDFVNTIERVGACSTHEQAKLILTSVFYSYRVNPLNSKEARLLEDRVEKFFEEKSE
jgi:hypothetical protein